MEPKTTRSFTALVAKSRDSLIYLVRCPDATDRQAWYFVQVDPQKQPLFARAMQAAGAVLDNFGKILASGYGDTPPPFILARIKEKYGFDPAFS